MSNAAPPIDFIKPLSSEAERASLDFYRELNFLLQFAPAHPSEKALMARFAKIGVGLELPVRAPPLEPSHLPAVDESSADWA